MELPRLRAFTSRAVAIPASAAPGLLASAERATLDHSIGDPVIVIGGGPAGLRVAQELTRRGRPVVLFNAERWRPYNRIKLTPFLAGEVQIGVVYQPDIFPPGARITQYTGQ